MGVHLVDGVRSPFVTSGGSLAHLSPAELGAIVLRELIERCCISSSLIDLVVVGSLFGSAESEDLARSIALFAGLPPGTPAHCISRGEASGFEAVIDGCRRVATGEAALVAVVGVDVVPAPMRRITPAGTDDLLRHLGISRDDQDRFAIRSHQRAIAAAAGGWLADEIMPVIVPPDYTIAVDGDEGSRQDIGLAELAAHPPFDDARGATITSANTAPFADGAVALLVGDSQRVRDLGLTPLGRLRGHSVVAIDPPRAVLAPALALARVMRSNGIPLANIDVVEIDEGSAAAIVAGRKVLSVDELADRFLDREKAIGLIDDARLNPNGGAIAIGLPPGASGVRLLLHLGRELGRRGLSLGVAVGGSASGQGQAILLERV